MIWWWINVDFIVDVLESLCMGEPMNSKCAHSMKLRGFSVRSNFHLTSELPVAEDLEHSADLPGKICR